MKKHNEGYALALVLVVLVIVCLVAVSILSISLNNLQSQKASIARMKAQYEAQGKIEQVVAKLEQDIGDTSKYTENNEYKFFKSVLRHIDNSPSVIGKADNGEYVIQLIDIDLAQNKDKNVVVFSVIATAEVSNYTAEIICKIQISGEKSIEQKVLSSDDDFYAIENPQISYYSYEITTTEVVAGGGS